MAARATFRLTADNQFIHTSIEDEKDRDDNIIVAIYVSEYKDNPDEFAITEDDEDKGNVSRWSAEPLARVSNVAGQLATHQALEVNGVTFEGEKLTELFKDLSIVREKDREKRKTHLLVNRQGLVFVDVGGEHIRKLRVNDYFGWSKYKVDPVAHKDEWKRLDMHTGKEIPPPSSSDSSDSWAPSWWPWK